MTDRKPLHGLVPAAALIALAVAGCGGAGGNSDSSFISKLNAECRKAQSQVDALGQPASSSPADEAAFFSKILPIVESEGSTIKAISAPSDKAADFAAANVNHDETLTLLKQAIAAGDAGDKTQLNQILTQAQTLSATGDALATKIGATDCVTKNASTPSTTNTTTT
jgi:outer membrane murein-binding lipoprotein Lpp